MSAGKVVLTAVDVVPANTGVVLYCETAGDYQIPVTTTDATVTGNEMVGVTARTLVGWSTDGKYNYILQSGQFNKATDGYLKANRAYLHTSYDVTQAGAHSMNIVFGDDDTTSLRDAIANEKSGTGRADYYNLSGQRVSQPTKGLYIVNGKKAIFK